MLCIYQWCKKYGINCLSHKHKNTLPPQNATHCITKWISPASFLQDMLTYYLLNNAEYDNKMAFVLYILYDIQRSNVEAGFSTISEVLPLKIMLLFYYHWCDIIILSTIITILVVLSPFLFISYMCTWLHVISILLLFHYRWYIYCCWYLF